jgi:ADP-ribose pyrophosphatase YjhB (NUDIX family)
MGDRQPTEYKLVIVAIIHENFKKALLVKRARPPFKDQWALSGGWGALEEQKDPTKAICLEVKGELGVEFPWSTQYLSLPRR